MTPEQHYLFDVTGYLHIKNAVTGDALKEAQDAVDRYIHMPLDERPEGFTTRPRDLEPGKEGNCQTGCCPINGLYPINGIPLGRCGF